MTEDHVVLASTIRHVYIAAGLAHAHTQYRWHLVLIDQENDKLPHFMSAIMENNSPFKSCNLFKKPKAKGLARALQRKAQNEHIVELLRKLQTKTLYTGNDRRMEFQQSMSRLNSVQGVYLDDGISSYMDIIATRPLRKFIDHAIDSNLKRILYGHCYDRPGIFGSSRWISKRWLMFDSNKTDNACWLNPQWFTNTQFTALLDSKLPVQFKPISVDTLVILPPSTAMKRMMMSLQRYREHLLNSVAHEKLAFKYHPLDRDDPLELSQVGDILPADLPMEMLLPKVTYTKIIGDVSTALLSSKWLYPKADVVCRLPNQSRYNRAVKQVFENVNIQVIGG